MPADKKGTCCIVDIDSSSIRRDCGCEDAYFYVFNYFYLYQLYHDVGGVM